MLNLKLQAKESLRNMQYLSRQIDENIRDFNHLIHTSEISLEQGTSELENPSFLTTLFLNKKGKKFKENLSEYTSIIDETKSALETEKNGIDLYLSNMAANDYKVKSAGRDIIEKLQNLESVKKGGKYQNNLAFKIAIDRNIRSGKQKLREIQYLTNARKVFDKTLGELSEKLDQKFQYLSEQEEIIDANTARYEASIPKKASLFSRVVEYFKTPEPEPKEEKLKEIEYIPQPEPNTHSGIESLYEAAKEAQKMYSELGIKDSSELDEAVKKIKNEGQDTKTTGRITELQKQLNHYENIKEQLENSIFESEAKAKQYQAQVKNVEAEKEQLTDLLTGYQAQINNQASQGEDEKTRYQESQNAINALEKENKVLTELIGEYQSIEKETQEKGEPENQSEIDELISQVSQYKQKSENEKKRATELEKKIGQYEKKAQYLGDKLVQSELKDNRDQEERKQLREENSELHTTNEQKEAMIHYQKSKYTDLESKYDQLQVRTKEYEEKISQLESNLQNTPTAQNEEMIPELVVQKETESNKTRTYQQQESSIDDLAQGITPDKPLNNKNYSNQQQTIFDKAFEKYQARTTDPSKRKDRKTFNKEVSNIFEYSQKHYRTSIDKIVQDTGTDIVTDGKEAKDIINYAMETSCPTYSSQRYNSNIASEDMKNEIVKLYATADGNLGDIQDHIAEKYNTIVSTTTISKHARDTIKEATGKDVSRKAGKETLKEAYKEMKAES